MENKQTNCSSQGFFKLKSACVILAAVMVLPSCQTVSDDVLSSTNYSENTSPSANRTQKSPKEIAQIRTQLAGQYIRQKRLDDAKRQLERAFDVNSNYAPAYDMMGVLLQQEGSAINLKKAESYFKKAISIDRNFMQTRNNYGVYLSQTKRYAEAAKQFEIAGSALGYQGRLSALENLGRTYLKLNQKDKAIQSFQRALDGNSFSLIARIELIDLLLDDNQTAQAQRVFDDVKYYLRSQPMSPRLLLQGIRLAHVFGDDNTQRTYSEQLLSDYPLSDESKKLKQWLRNPRAAWR